MYDAHGCGCVASTPSVYQVYPGLANPLHAGMGAGGNNSTK